MVVVVVGGNVLVVLVVVVGASVVLVVVVGARVALAPLLHAANAKLPTATNHHRLGRFNLHTSTPIYSASTVPPEAPVVLSCPARRTVAAGRCRAAGGGRRAVT